MMNNAWYRAWSEQLWHWGLVRNILCGNPNESVRILLHFCIFDAILYLEAGLIDPPMGCGNTVPLMMKGYDGGRLMQATQLPRGIMEGMRLGCLHCAVSGTPPHFVVNAVSNIVQSVLTHTLVETELFIGYNTCRMCRGSGIHSFGLTSPPPVSIPPPGGGGGTVTG